jgi:hypothetical protein
VEWAECCRQNLELNLKLVAQIWFTALWNVN